MRNWCRGSRAGSGKLALVSSDNPSASGQAMTSSEGLWRAAGTNPLHHAAEGCAGLSLFAHRRRVSSIVSGAAETQFCEKTARRPAAPLRRALSKCLRRCGRHPNTERAARLRPRARLRQPRLRPPGDYGSDFASLLLNGSNIAFPHTTPPRGDVFPTLTHLFAMRTPSRSAAALSGNSTICPGDSWLVDRSRSSGSAHSSPLSEQL
jgi:hypothetical protein